MSLTRRTTVLFPPELYERLATEARHRGVSMGHLIRAACEEVYRAGSDPDRLAAARALARLSLPVGTPEEMGAESVPDPETLLP